MYGAENRLYITAKRMNLHDIMSHSRLFTEWKATYEDLGCCAWAEQQDRHQVSDTCHSQKVIKVLLGGIMAVGLSRSVLTGLLDLSLSPPLTGFHLLVL